LRAGEEKIVKHKLPEEDSSEQQDTPTIPRTEPAAGTGSLEAALAERESTIKRFLKVLGPGLITGASDDDPSGIGTYTAAGASLGFATLWTALLTFPLMAVVQYTCAKVGMVSGRGLAGVLRRHYTPWVVYPAIIGLLLANTINAGADIGAIAAAINLLVPVPALVFIVPISLIILALQIWGSYRLIAKVFRWLTLALFAYIGSVFFAHPDALAVLKGTFIPTLQWNSTFIATLVAILGTTISPYLFFWQSSQEVDEEISKGRTNLQQRKGATDKELTFAAWDVNIGMLLSNLVMYCIILATAATLFHAGKHNVQTATDAAVALRPIAGNAASILLAAGLIGSGFLAVPILTGSAAYALAEVLGWRHGFEKKLRGARQFYIIIVVATVVAMLINFIGINPITALFWTAVINGVLAPPLLILLMLVVNNPRIMGARVNNFWLNLGGWLTTLIMFAAALAMFLTLG
jgi:NRAMP (natural resistance-associated macrophage protein)-like metal ion transporter